MVLTAAALHSKEEYSLTDAGDGGIAVKYPSLAIPLIQTMKMESDKGHFFIKRKKLHAACWVILHTSSIVVVAKPIILNTCAEMFLL